MNGSLVTDSSYTDDTADSGNSYYYIVTAVDTESNESDDSIEVPVTLSNTGMGRILRQWWTGISGSYVSDLISNSDYPDSPDGNDLLANLEGPRNWADSYGTRIRGYLYPPAAAKF